MAIHTYLYFCQDHLYSLQMLTHFLETSLDGEEPVLTLVRQSGFEFLSPPSQSGEVLLFYFRWCNTLPDSISAVLGFHCRLVAPAGGKIPLHKFMFCEFGGLADIHSCPGHFLISLLQYALHGTAFEDHPKVISGPECSSTCNSKHPAAIAGLLTVSLFLGRIQLASYLL